MHSGSSRATLPRTWYLALTLGCISFYGMAQAHPKEPAKPGVSPAHLQHSMAQLQPQATFHAKGMPDWMAVTPNAIWVSSSRAGIVTRLDPKTNQAGQTIQVALPCSGLIFDSGSLWIPSCGDHTLVRANAETGSITARIAAGPADSEGGIAAGAGSIWLVTSAKGTLSRIDEASNRVQASITIPSGSFNPVFAGGMVWVSSNDHDALIKIDPSTNKVVATIPVGKKPRFLTAGAGSIWTLNQGDGSISRVDIASGRKIAEIEAGIPGSGGEITFGFNAVWATVIGFPITRVDADTNKITAQWKGPGGDSIRAAFGSIWLTDLFKGTIWRFAPAVS